MILKATNQTRTTTKCLNKITPHKQMGDKMSKCQTATF